MAEHQDDHNHTERGHGGRKREQHRERPATSPPVGEQAEKDQAEGRDRPPADRGRPKNTPWLGGG